MNHSSQKKIASKSLKMSQPSRLSDSNTIQPLGTTSRHLRATHLKSANRQIVRVLLSLASAALLIRIAGMVNQIVVSSRFGAGAEMDAYFIASALPILLAEIVENPIEAAIIPSYVRVYIKETKEHSSVLFSTLLNLLIVGAVLLSSVMLIFRSQIVFLSAPGSRSGVIELAIGLAPFTFLAFLLMVVISYLECILNTKGQFGWPAYAGMLVPLTTSVLVFAVGASLGVIMLCVGMVVGLCLQLCVIILRARRAGLSYRLVMDLRNPEIASVMIVAWPVLIGALISHASLLVDQIFASYLPVGSISAISYALKIVSVFSGVIFTSVGRAAHPYLSRQAALNDMKAFKETLRFYIWIVAIGVIALSALVIVFAHPLVHLLFQRGVFSTDDTNRTAIVLVGFAIGLAPMAFAFIAFRAFSALGKTKVLMYLATCTLFTNAILDYIFSRYWQSFGIALATSVYHVCNMFILLFILERLIGKLNLFTPPHELLQLLWKLRGTTRWITWKRV